MIPLLVLGTPAFANDVPEPPEPPPVRDTNTGFGFGIAYLGTNDATSDQRYGLHVDFRSEVPISRAFQFDFVIAAGITTPRNTVAMARFGTDVGRGITAAFGDVYDWARGRRDGLGGLRQPLAFFAYVGLGVSYVAVPVIWILSPVASIGHGLVGPTISFHTSPRAPDAWVEVGVGGALYGDPSFPGPGVGYGPMVGAGAHVGKQTVSVRLLASPPGMHAASQPSSDTVLAGSFVVTL